MAKAAPIPGLSAGTRFGDAAAAAVEVRAGELFEHAAGVLDTSDIERVHDMRVATRRLRAALEVFTACFEKSEHGALLEEVRALADALGERRDPDVAIEELEKVAGELTRADGPGVASLVAEHRAEQARGNEALSEALERLGETRLEERLAALARSARAAPEPALALEPAPEPVA